MRPRNTHASFHRRAALTLLEMMVAVTLLALIMIGLLAMFQQVQKALQVANAQTDVFENARGAIQLITRDLTEMRAFGETNVANAYGTWAPSPAGTLGLPSGGNQRLDLNEAFWLTRVNDEWQGIGYYVSEDATNRANAGVGTLYRFSQSTNRGSVFALNGFFTSEPGVRVSDGIVHFALDAVYAYTNFTQTNFARASNYTFTATSLPAYVDVEIGVLEPATLKQFKALKDFDVVAAQTFLRDHVGRIHFFRERVPIRNFINPYRANEVP